MVFDADGLKTIHNHDFLKDPAFADAYIFARNLIGKDYKWYFRNYIGLELASLAKRGSLNFVECGVGEGWMSISIIRYFRQNHGIIPYMTLFDTFKGIDPDVVSPDEILYWGKPVEEVAKGYFYSNSTFEKVKKNFDIATGCSPRITFVQGSIPGSMTTEVIGSIAARGPISFLHIDMNNSTPEVYALEHLYPLVASGGFVLFDDYAYKGYEFQKQQIDKSCQGIGIETPITLPTGQGLLIKI